MFQLSQDEKNELVAKCDQFKNLKHSSVLPRAFTEHGALMLANVLSSSTAIDASIEVIRSLIKLRELGSFNEELRQKFEKVENKIFEHEGKLKILFETLHQVIAQPTAKRRSIGIHKKD